MTYDRLAFLGELESFSTNKDYKHGYRYTILAENGERIYLSFNESPYASGYLDTECFSALSFAELVDDSNMMLLNVEAVSARLGVDIGMEDYVCMDTKEVVYYYSHTGNLEYIALHHNGVSCYIVTDFSKCAPDSCVGKLLYLETASAAAAEIKARLAGFYHEPWEQPLTICLSAVFGAIVAGVGAWLVTFLVMRKKHGAFMPVTAGAPAEEISTGEGMAAEETPVEEALAPPEDTPPPPEDTPPTP